MQVAIQEKYSVRTLGLAEAIQLSDLWECYIRRYIN
jgi:hypothetical protein